MADDSERVQVPAENIFVPVKARFLEISGGNHDGTSLLDLLNKHDQQIIVAFTTKALIGFRDQINLRLREIDAE
jgi:hypothetical protein